MNLNWESKALPFTRDFLGNGARQSAEALYGAAAADIHVEFAGLAGRLTEHYGEDPRQAAEQAWQRGELWQHALAIERFPDTVPSAELAMVKTFEVTWQSYVQEHPFFRTPKSVPKPILSRIFSHFPQAIWADSPVAKSELQGTLTATDWQRLHAAALLPGFFRKMRIDYAAGAAMAHFAEQKEYNCATSAAVTLHLLRLIGIDNLRALTIPEHATLAMPLDCGLFVYFNNAKEFLPPDFFHRSRNIWGYDRVGQETLSPPWAIASAIHLNHGVALDSQDFIDGALLAFQAAVHINPSYAHALTNGGSILNRLNQHDRERLYLEASLNLNPYHVRTVKNLGNAYEDLARPDEGRTLYRRALALQDTAELRLAFAGMLSRIGDEENAILCLKEAIATDPENAELHFELGLVYFNTEAFDESLKALETCLNLDSEHINAIYYTARIQHQKKNYDTARNGYVQALRLDNKSARAFNSLGIYYHDLGDFPRCIECYRRACDLEPNEELYQENLLAASNEWLGI